MKTTLPLLLAAAVLAGCSTAGYSRIEGYRYSRTALDTYPVIVLAVDGSSTSSNIPVLVEPGRHRIDVQAYPTKTQHFGEVRSIELDVQACTRYYLVAVKKSPLAADFQVKVDYAEPMAGCTAPAA